MSRSKLNEAASALERIGDKSTREELKNQQKIELVDNKIALKIQLLPQNYLQSSQ